MFVFTTLPGHDVGLEMRRKSLNLMYKICLVNFDIEPK